ncbi:MAG: hypothetical protein LBT23_08100, partial [Synergistaceae bacterium]|nr:hypothetical protein [Synergistaceae bacterium]
IKRERENQRVASDFHVHYPQVERLGGLQNPVDQPRVPAFAFALANSSVVNQPNLDLRRQAL